jgi:hypothetical protein
MEKIRELDFIDITIAESGPTCRNEGVNSCCLRAIERGINLLDVGQQAVSAEVRLSCPGKSQDNLCQAQVEGSVLDAEGVTLIEINTTAAELRGQ